MEPYNPNKPWLSVNLPSREELIAMAMGLIPGGRALKYYHDNPEGSATEFADLLAEDIVPEYRNLIKPALTGEDIDWEDAAKEAAIFGIPMPYTKFPKGHSKAGEAIPNNLKEGYGNRNWNAVKYGWKHDISPRKLYTEEALPNRSVPREGLSTNSRIDRTQTVVPMEEVVGPYQSTNTGSNIQNTGRQIRGTNRVPSGNRRGTNYTGELGWQGDMYPPGRRLRNDEMYGPYQWEDKYSRKLDDAIDANEYKWEYLINKTRPGVRATVVPKQDIVDIALNQGRPDIAQRVINDDKPRVPNNKDNRFASYATIQTRSKFDNAKWKDVGNRAVEKELRETFAALPNDPDIRYRFAEHYGVPDLYQSWINDPLLWDKLKAETEIRRYQREAANRTQDRYYQRDIER
jgi:hypothetical protein